MVGGVMTTGHTMHKGRARRRCRALLTDRQFDYGQDFARLMPGAADRLWQAMIAAGSIGAASPPE